MRTLLLLLLGCCAVSGQLVNGTFVNGVLSNAAPLIVYSLTTPTNPIVEWLKADAMVMANDAAVATWTNSAGLNAVEATGSKQPLFKTNVKNGLPTVRFDGTDDVLTTGDIGTFAQPYTVFLVFKPNAVPSSGLALVLDGFNGSFRSAFFLSATTGKFEVYAGTSLTGTSVATNTTWSILKLEFNGASSKMQFNDGTDTTTAASPGAHSLRGVVLGKDVTATSYSSVDIGEVIYYRGLLNATDATNVRDSLNAKWSVY